MSEPNKKLYRSSSNGMLAGVCAGIAEYMGMDVTVVRIASVVLFLITGLIPFAIAYVVAAAIMPSSPGLLPGAGGSDESSLMEDITDLTDTN